MERHFHKDLADLRQQIFQMGLAVEQTIDKAIKALIHHDRALAQKVFDDECHINQMEVNIDEKGHNLLALDQPMAADLRLITMILKMSTDLERMADHAFNIAERVMLLLDKPFLEDIVHLPQMASAVQKMLRDALESFIDSDIALAQNVLTRDDEVDAYNDRLEVFLQELMEKNVSMVKTGMLLIRIGHDLERIADLANNLAEDVIYMKQGKEVRHHLG